MYVPRHKKMWSMQTCDGIIYSFIMLPHVKEAATRM